MRNYQSIKELVIDAYVSLGSMPEYESLTEKIKFNFPLSKWQRSHYSWYKSQITTGKITLPENGESVEDIGEASIEESISESIETQVSLERDLQNYLAVRLHEIEPELVLFEGGIEYVTEAGRIDILAKDKSEFTVVIELKAGKAKDSALGQILGYIGCLSSSHKNIRGILVASDFDPRVVFAAKALPNIKLIKYELKFNLREIT